MHLNRLTVICGVLTLIYGCSAEFSSKRRVADNGAPGTEDANPNQPGNIPVSPPGEETPEEILPEQGAGLSLRSHVRFKKQKLLKNDIASALDLPAAELCKEFDRLSCLDEVHHLAVGGVDAYQKSIFEGIEESLTTTPIVIERTILSACTTRANRDVSGREGVIFAGLDQNASATALGEAITNLYRRALQRNPTADETAALQGLFDQVKPASQNPAEDWAALTCYAVLSSLEFVFY